MVTRISANTMPRSRHSSLAMENATSEQDTSEPSMDTRLIHTVLRVKRKKGMALVALT